jgi:glycolate oxidase FAD binding subunit
LNEDKHRLFWLNLSEPTIDIIDTYSALIRAKLNYPISKWKDILNAAENIFSESDLVYALEVQAGSGICMITLLPKKDDSISSDRSVEALKTLLNTCLEANGNLVIQEAPTEIKRRLMVWGEPGSDFLIMERLKKQIDPNGIMSPGRFVGGL